MAAIMTLGCLWTQLPTARAYEPPKPCVCVDIAAGPDNPGTACLADVTLNDNVTSTIRATSATFNRGYSFSCVPADQSLCSACHYSQTGYIDPNGTFQIAATSTPTKVSGKCGTNGVPNTYTVPVTSTYTYGVPKFPASGTAMASTLYVASWNPKASTDCSITKQLYNIDASTAWTMP
jgi:hypothetical protein